MTQVLFEASAAEQKIDDLRDKYFKKQMQRMKKGKCKPQSRNHFYRDADRF